MYAKHTVQKYSLFGSANTLQGTTFDLPANALSTRDNLLLEVVSVLGAEKHPGAWQEIFWWQIPEAEV